MHIRTSDQPGCDLGFGGYTCNWGVHIAGLYETEQERDDIIMGYLHQGDIEGDLQLYSLAERTVEDFTETYGHRFPICADHITDPSRFSMPAPRELYYPDGIFSPWVMDKSLGTFFEESQRDGERHVRATAEMVWALEAIPGVEHLMAYESRLNYFIPGKPWISICLYNVTKFDGATVMQVLRTHPYTISGGIITENPYYQDPDIWLRDNAPEFLTPPIGVDDEG